MIKKEYSGYAKIAMEQTRKQISLEEKIAKEWYGKSYDELDEDEKLEVGYEAIDRMNGWK